ncbi:MAG: cell division protein SepF [Acidobacteria bacterium]|nr:cell division protein SepF [Acidobacteriota bacterium]NDC48469.1 DUF552 domain-containing protein [Micrococcales bacterium]
MSGAIDWLKELFGLSGKGPKPAAQPKASSSGRTERVKVQRPSRSNQGVHRIETVTMTSYSDALQIADILRENITAVVNVKQLSSTDRARLIDFMMGLKAGLLAQSQRVAEDVYLLAPENVEVEPGAEDDEDDVDDGDRLIIRP